MPGRFKVGPRFELFLALAEVLDPGAEDALWLSQARRKLDPPTRRRMGDLALTPAIWRALAAVPERAALDGDTGAVIAALAEVPAEDFARRCRGALTDGERDPALERLLARLDSDPAGLQQAAIDTLRRFDRLVFAAFWRHAQLDLEQAALNGVAPPETGAATIVFPSRFGAQRFQFGEVLVLTVPAERLTQHHAPPPAAGLGQDPELVFRALGDATRYAIARLIAREALTSAALARRLGVSGPTLTHHLKQLRRTGLVLEERRGNSILLRLERRAIEILSGTALQALFGSPGRNPPVAIRRSRRA
jgi:DNA-binding transcriptional ArsR family regulator